MIKSAYFYLKHEQIPQKCILEQVLSEGSTAQNGQKVLKIAQIHYFTVGASRGQVRVLAAKSDFQGLARPQNPF